jgi:hypothetical protein
MRATPGRFAHRGKLQAPQQQASPVRAQRKIENCRSVFDLDQTAQLIESGVQSLFLGPFQPFAAPPQRRESGAERTPRGQMPGFLLFTRRGSMLLPQRLKETACRNIAQLSSSAPGPD